MTADEFASETGGGSSTVYRWENGNRMPDVVTMMRIAKVLGVELNDLTGE